MSLDGSDGSVKYEPEGVRRIDYISAIGDNVILITEGVLDSRILECNIQTKEVIKRVGIRNPAKVNVVQDGEDTKYIVKCVSTNWVVNNYNRDWNLISTIDINPDALTVTPGGKLLLACDNRFYVYNQDGRSIRELLDKYQFKTIEDITCDGGCLWVLETNPCCIKIFMSI